MFLFCSKPNLVASVRSNMEKSGKTVNWRYLDVRKNIIRLIESGRIASPLNYLQLVKSPILGKHALVLSMAIRDGNMSAMPTAGQQMMMPTFQACNKSPLEAALGEGDSTFPYHFDSQDKLFSFVTCAGQLDEKYSLAIWI